MIQSEEDLKIGDNKLICNPIKIAYVISNLLKEPVEENWDNN